MFRRGQKTYVIAEIGANHNGDMELARKMIRTAKDCGSDAVKFQSWDTGIFSRTVYEENTFLKDDYRDRDDYTLKEIVAEFAVTEAELTALKSYCDEVGIDFASTPFEPEQVDALVRIGAPFIKVASMDLTNDYLLRHIGRTGLPVLLSTGLGTLAEIDDAVRVLEGTGNRNIVILHCVSLYPPDDSQVNLNNIDMLAEAYDYPIGYSDHTIGTEISLAAMAKGACVLEKHFTLDKDMFGWDHKVSANPEEMAAIGQGRDRIFAALGSKRRTVAPEEEEKKKAFRRSVVSQRDIAAGEIIDAEAITYRRPGTGIPPNLAHLVIGATATKAIRADSLIDWHDIDPPDA